MTSTSPPGSNNTTLEGGRTETSQAAILLHDISAALWRYVRPATIILGTFGNVMTLVIMRKMTSSDSAVHVYFTSLAVVDLVVLYGTSFIGWLGGAFGLRVENMHSVSCKMFIWVSFSMPMASAWILVCLTLHRAASVLWPHKVSSILPRSRVVVVVIVVVVFSGLFHAHNFFIVDAVPVSVRGNVNGSSGDSVQVCTSYPEFEYFRLGIFIYVDMVVTSIAPFLFLAIGNAVLVWKLVTSVRNVGVSLTLSDPDQAAARAKTTTSVTLTVVVVSLTFVVLTLPALVYLSVFFMPQARGVYSGLQRAQLQLFNTVSYLMWGANYAVNFYLYVLTGKRFREEFVKVIHCGSRSRLQLKDTREATHAKQSTRCTEVESRVRVAS